MNRRDFIKSLGALAVVGVLGMKLSNNPDEVIEIVDYAFDEDAIMAAMTFGSITERGGKLTMDIYYSGDQTLLDAMTFIDSNGNEYSYREIKELADQ